MNQPGGRIGKRKDTLKVSIAERDLIKICYLYYRDEKTQEEIASLFGISRFRVLRLLREARAKGLVTIEIHDPQEKLASLEVELAKTFGLKESVVIRIDDFSDRSPLEQLGEAGARYLVRVLDRYKVLGVAWGQMASGPVAYTSYSSSFQFNVTVQSGQFAPGAQVLKLATIMQGGTRGVSTASGLPSSGTANAFLNATLQLDPGWSSAHPGYTLVMDPSIGVSPVPAPASAATMLAGLTLIAGLRRSRSTLAPRRE